MVYSKALVAAQCSQGWVARESLGWQEDRKRFQNQQYDSSFSALLMSVFMV